jgi:cellulose synthase/poly-beta-1,6-N-acetylglucosamine synthase-like glycosyltransferase
VFYTYIGYGLVLFVLVKVKDIFSKKPIYNADYQPTVTLVVPAFNEESFILEKVKNSLDLDYPKGKLRILFVTDGSTDKTYQILKEAKGVELSHEDRRAGKAAAENRAMTLVDTPIVVFCDANTYLNRDCIKNLVRHYENPKVGAVSGEKRVMSSGADTASAAGEGLYWKYESILKRWDSELYTIVGAAGELISFRSELVQDLEEDTILDDFMQTMRICQQGYRVVYEPDSYAAETASDNVKEELKRKVRIAAGGWQSMRRLWTILIPIPQPILTFQYISHRVLRWSMSAFVLPVIFILNSLLFSQSDLYQYLLYAQVLFYVTALIGWFLENKSIRVKVLFVPYYFLMMNYAVFLGFGRWLKGSQKVTWERAKRAEQKN